MGRGGVAGEDKIEISTAYGSTLKIKICYKQQFLQLTDQFIIKMKSTLQFLSISQMTIFVQLQNNQIRKQKKNENKKNKKKEHEV